MKLDTKDMQILEILENDSKLSVKQISKLLKTPMTTVHNRIKRLEQSGIIKGYTLKIDYELIGKEIKAYIFSTVIQNLSTGEKLSQKSIAEKILKFPEVESVDIVTGSTDMIIIVRTRNVRELNELITSKLRKVNGVDKTQTLVVLEELE